MPSNSPLRFGFLLHRHPAESFEPEQKIRRVWLHNTAFLASLRAPGLPSLAMLSLTLPPDEVHGRRSASTQLPASDALPLPKLEKLSRSEPEDRQAMLRIALEGLGRVGFLEEGEAACSVATTEELIEARLRCFQQGLLFSPCAKDGKPGGEKGGGGTKSFIFFFSPRGTPTQLNHAWERSGCWCASPVKARRRSPEGGVQCILERATPTWLPRWNGHEDRLVRRCRSDGTRLLTRWRFQPADDTYLGS